MVFWRKRREKERRRRERTILAMREAVNDVVDDVKSGMELDVALYDDFWRAKKTAAYQRAFTEKRPLVSVCTATYNRPELLLNRTLPSVLNQSYENIEYIVVGDGCDEDAYAAVYEVNDPRFRFINLPQQGCYPENPELRWMVAGGVPLNAALEHSRGLFITHLDDDDTYSLDRIEKLVAFAQQTRHDFVWHPFERESSDGGWVINEARHFTYGHVTNSGVFYHSWLNRIPFDLEAFRLREPGDWNRFRKFRHLGVSAGRYPEPLLRHYVEGSQKSPLESGGHMPVVR